MYTFNFWSAHSIQWSILLFHKCSQWNVIPEYLQCSFVVHVICMHWKHAAVLMQSEPPHYNRPDVLPGNRMPSDRVPHKTDSGRSTSCPHPWPTSRGSAPGVKGPADLEGGGSRDGGMGRMRNCEPMGRMSERRGSITHKLGVFGWERWSFHTSWHERWLSPLGGCHVESRAHRGRRLVLHTNMVARNMRPSSGWAF